ncbi:MAG: DUF4232 domain-containing protein [Actinophytocola sp.]|nr:DUF4232 domain-containing protein [Actinophytocola sp.]
MAGSDVHPIWRHTKGVDVVDTPARGRRRRAPVVAAAAATLLLVGGAGVLLAACLPSNSRSSPATPGLASSPTPTVSVVPWSDRTDYQPAKRPPRETRAPTAPCAPSDLRLDGLTMEGATGHVGTWVNVRNAGSARCSLGGYPTLLGRDHSADAELTAIPVEHGTFFDLKRHERPATIDPGETGTVVIETALACGDQTAVYDYQDVRLVFDDGTRMSLDSELTSSCGIRIGSWYRDNAAPDPPSRFAHLKITIEPARTARPGSTLEYVVRLANTGDSAIDPTPCPGFRQLLSPWTETSNAKLGKPIVYDTWRLNCDQVGTLTPGEAARFAMRVDVPDEVSSDALAIDWWLIDSKTTRTATARIDVARPPR